MKKVTIADVQVFSNESFLEHYSTLIDVAMTSGREDAVMGALSFINDLKRLIEDLKEDMTGEPDGCQNCKKKDTVIKMLQERIDIHNDLEKELKAFNKELRNENDKLRQKQQEPQKLKVCK